MRSPGPPPLLMNAGAPDDGLEAVEGLRIPRAAPNVSLKTEDEMVQKDELFLLRPEAGRLRGGRFQLFAGKTRLRQNSFRGPRAGLLPASARFETVERLVDRTGDGFQLFDAGYPRVLGPPADGFQPHAPDERASRVDQAPVDRETPPGG